MDQNWISVRESVLALSNICYQVSEPKIKSKFYDSKHCSVLLDKRDAGQLYSSTKDLMREKWLFILLKKNFFFALELYVLVHMLILHICTWISNLLCGQVTQNAIVHEFYQKLKEFIQVRFLYCYRHFYLGSFYFALRLE